MGAVQAAIGKPETASNAPSVIGSVGAVQDTIVGPETVRNALSVIGSVAAASFARILVKLLLTT